MEACNNVNEEDNCLFFGSKKKMKEKRKNQRKDKVKEKTIINNSDSNNPYANNSYFTRGGEKQNQKPQADAVVVGNGKPDKNKLIPLAELPEDIRRIVTAWNRLRLKIFYGLFPGLVEKVKALLRRFGMEAVLSGIAGIAESDFLLGKIKNKPFKVTFTWLLDPENFAKVLSGRYRNEFDEYDQWLDGEPLPCSLTGETEDRDMTREERRRAIEKLWNPQTPEKAEAARLLGLA